LLSILGTLRWVTCSDISRSHNRTWVLCRRKSTEAVWEWAHFRGGCWDGRTHGHTYGQHIDYNSGAYRSTVGDWGVSGGLMLGTRWRKFQDKLHIIATVTRVGVVDGLHIIVSIDFLDDYYYYYYYVIMLLLLLLLYFFVLVSNNFFLFGYFYNCI
jgi:hypothetical protein